MFSMVASGGRGGPLTTDTEGSMLSVLDDGGHDHVTQ